MKKFSPQARVSRRRDERDGAGRASRRSARRTRTDWRRARVRSASPTGRLHSVCIAALPGSSDASCFVPFAPRRAPTAPRPHAVCSPTKVPSCCCCLFFFSLRLSSSLRRFYSRMFSSIDVLRFARTTTRIHESRIIQIHAVMDIIRPAGILRGSREPGCRFTKTTKRSKMDCGREETTSCERQVVFLGVIRAPECGWSIKIKI